MSDRFARSRWFQQDRFGMFIHWGPYSVAGRGEWQRSHEELPKEAYQPSIDAFQPHDFDAESWADAAEKAGMRYAVLTVKHHDGFCLFDSRHAISGVMTNGFGRDLLAEFLAAFRARGIKVGVYFSLIDWSHPDYPAYGDLNHPHRHDEAYRDVEHDWDRYLDFLHAQVREVMSNYGKLDLLWFDFSYDDMSGEKWRARELVEMIRELQPEILLNNRLEANGGSFGSIAEAEPKQWAGDFVSPEQLIPAEGILDEAGSPIPWEACMTFNNHWGWYRGDHAFKSSTTIIRKLIEVVSKGGNLLLNIGPDRDGRISGVELRILEDVGQWLRANGESIYGAGRAGIAKPEWGYYTSRDDMLYAHVLEQPIGPLALVGVDTDTIEEIVIDSRPVERAESWLIEAYPDVAFVSWGDDDPAFTYAMPDERATVVSLRRG